MNEDEKIVIDLEDEIIIYARDGNMYSISNNPSSFGGLKISAIRDGEPLGMSSSGDRDMIVIGI